MHKERSGSLGSAKSVLMEGKTPTESSSGDITSLVEIENSDDLRKLVRELRQKTRAQAQQILAWRRAYKMQESFVSRLQREKCDQLKALSSKLLLFESRLIRKQKDISNMLTLRETIIHRQQKLIETLTNRLVDNGLEIPQSELTDIDINLPDLDSLNDSDSAVVMEDVDSDSNIYHVPRYRSDGITVMRSISDAIDPNYSKYCMRRCNGYLRRPEVLETVYSVEEDADNENHEGKEDEKTEANKKRDAFASSGGKTTKPCDDEKPNTKERSKEKKVYSYKWSKNDDKSDESPQEENSGKTQTTNQVKTYNRVMSNHRSVTKPKDVKYKRINKAKSKSLEELRGRLKNWVEQGSKVAGITLEHSQSCA
ncbi:unnamed protein product [Brassicogethes aeneus]|uniref:Uncharacterized protein n=1 Tax=Brassicogethes aeneus TaxID=1431903 RepID=A0A9P0BCJ5_BRAAE|nr:unnamed protein product [Brassicogethes aeneus]